MFPVYSSDLPTTSGGSQGLGITITNWLRRVGRDREYNRVAEASGLGLLQDAFTTGDFNKVFSLRYSKATDALDIMLEVRSPFLAHSF